ncbi:MAG: hypothetical protein NXH87_07675 [Rhodobiaceae bacterium]|nr:hypothetical protein RHODOSMS8_01650 [Rhodobiaceae bacterium]MCR9241243.1 hypothetical protein [Rhodobiaceae bacterium]
MTCLKSVFALSISALLLAACSTAEDRAREQALQDRADDRHCRELGFEPETEPYGNCRLKLKEVRASQQAPNHPNFGVGVGIGIGL